MVRIHMLALLLAILPTAAADEIVVQRDVVYGVADQVELKLDLYKPAGDYQQAKGLLLVHGGGWQGGDKRDFEAYGHTAAKQGYVCASINYRLAPKYVFPAQVEDSKCAVRWMRANAESLKIDARRIGAVGASAGAHLVMMLGVLDPDDGLEGQGGHADQSSKVQAVVSLFGPTNLLAEYPPTSRGIVEKFLAGTKSEKADVYRRASPVTYVNGGDAPMLLYQGTQDILVPYDQAVQMAGALTRAGVGGRVELLLGANHGWGGKELERTARDSFAFLADQLQGPRGK